MEQARYVYFLGAKAHQDNFMTEPGALTTCGTALVLIFENFAKILLTKKLVIIFLILVMLNVI